jgi:hypothetical protein
VHVLELGTVAKLRTFATPRVSLRDQEVSSSRISGAEMPQIR